MATDELLDWIKRQKEKGCVPHEVHEVLVDKGWDHDKALEAVKSVYEEVKEEEKELQEKVIATLSFSPLTLAVIVVVGLGLAGGFFYMGFLNKDFQPIVESPKPIESSDTKSCPQFFQDLYSCEPSICEFSDGDLQRQIFKLEGSGCQYTEEMPGGGKMECMFTEDVRKAVARYYTDLSSTANLSFDMALSMNGTNTTYDINDTKVSNPLQEALTRGECRVVGYNDSSNTSQ